MKCTIGHVGRSARRGPLHDDLRPLREEVQQVGCDVVVGVGGVCVRLLVGGGGVGVGRQGARVCVRLVEAAVPQVGAERPMLTVFHH